MEVVGYHKTPDLDCGKLVYRQARSNGGAEIVCCKHGLVEDYEVTEFEEQATLPPGCEIVGECPDPDCNGTLVRAHDAVSAEAGGAPVEQHWSEEWCLVCGDKWQEESNKTVALQRRTA